MLQDLPDGTLEQGSQETLQVLLGLQGEGVLPAQSQNMQEVLKHSEAEGQEKLEAK